MPDQNDHRYTRSVQKWDEIFALEGDAVPAAPDSGNAAFDEALRRLCGGAKSVLDFGCGNGTMLLYCALLGTARHVGIDLSSVAVGNAQKRSAHMQTGEYLFFQGGTERLSTLPDESFDAIILSNILDNLYPNDAIAVISSSTRILKQGGRVLVKLNDFLTAEQIASWNIRVVEGDLLDDGLLLWNLTTERWRELLTEEFFLERYEEIEYPEYEQKNRLFLLVKR